MTTRESKARWEGTLKEGQGTYTLGRKAYEGRYSFPSRFEDGEGTNPEELVAAALAACYSMALSAGLEKAGHKAKRVDTVARVTLEKVGEGFEVTRLELNVEAEVPGVDEAEFKKVAEATKTGCPISKALASVKEIKLSTRLLAVAK